MNDRTNGAAGSRPDEDAEPVSHAKSRGTRAQERIAALDTSGAAAARLEEQLEQLRAELDAARERADEAEAGWQRARADFANFRRRSEEERQKQAGLASDSLLLKVVALADDFDLAIEHVPDEARGTPWLEGISAIYRKLRQLLESEDVVPMVTAEGAPFDPREHQGISYEDTLDVPDGSVIRALQRGYYVRDRVLRPALVAVARNDQQTPADEA